MSWKYLSMLTGDSAKVKPNRMIVRYVETALRGGRVLPEEAGGLLVAAAAALRGTHGYQCTLTARELDAAIWKVVRSATQ